MLVRIPRCFCADITLLFAFCGLATAGVFGFARPIRFNLLRSSRRLSYRGRFWVHTPPCFCYARSCCVGQACSMLDFLLGWCFCAEVPCPALTRTRDCYGVLVFLVSGSPSRAHVRLSAPVARVFVAFVSRVQVGVPETRRRGAFFCALVRLGARFRASGSVVRSRLFVAF